MDGSLVKRKSLQSVIGAFRGVICGDQSFIAGGRDNVEGNPAQPSLKMERLGKFRFRWIVTSGARTISVNVKQAINLTPRPTLVVKANSSIGVNSDVTGTAGSGTGWVTIGPVAINPSSSGAVWVELRANYDGQTCPSYWDNVVVT